MKEEPVNCKLFFSLLFYYSPVDKFCPDNKHIKAGADLAVLKGCSKGIVIQLRESLRRPHHGWGRRANFCNFNL